jgi:hypothetical protein
VEQGGFATTGFTQQQTVFTFFYAEIRKANAFLISVGEGQIFDCYHNAA